MRKLVVAIQVVEHPTKLWKSDIRNLTSLAQVSEKIS